MAGVWFWLVREGEELGVEPLLLDTEEPKEEVFCCFRTPWALPGEGF